MQFNRHVKDKEGTIITRINGIYYAWKGSFVEVLWIHEEHHHKGLGSKLLSEIEILAKESRFHPMHLDTFNF